MLKDTGYQEKFELVKEWMDVIVGDIKNDLKREHLQIDKQFCKRYFLGKTNLQTKEMSRAYLTDIAKGNIGLGEFIATRWLYKHSDVYTFFEEALKSITPEFETIERIEDAIGDDLIERSIQKYGAITTYLFCVLNSVVFSDRLYASLRERAENE